MHQGVHPYENHDPSDCTYLCLVEHDNCSSVVGFQDFCLHDNDSITLYRMQ